MIKKERKSKKIKTKTFGLKVCEATVRRMLRSETFPEYNDVIAISEVVGIDSNVLFELLGGYSEVELGDKLIDKIKAKCKIK